MKTYIIKASEKCIISHNVSNAKRSLNSHKETQKMPLKRITMAKNSNHSMPKIMLLIDLYVQPLPVRRNSVEVAKLLHIT